MTHHEHCGTCGRSTAACAECAQEWPDGVPGYLDSGGWHNGPRPTTPEHTTPELTAATKRLDKAQANYDAARARWEAAASAHHSARAAGAQTVLGTDGQLHEIGTVTPAARRVLAEAEESAQAERDAAGEHLVQARMAHRDLQSVTR